MRPAHGGVPTLVLLLLACASCGPPAPTADGDPELDVHLRISPTPPMAGTATVAVEFTDAGEPAPVDGSVEVSVEREAGLPSPPFALSAIRPGRWQGEVRFTAPGEVTVRVRVTLPSGRTAVFAFPVTVTRRPGG